jgi:hypothetical protein
MAMLLPAPFAFTADDATSLAARAEYVIDHWDGNPESLASAGEAIEQAVKLDPTNFHFCGIQARQLLLANTTDEGIKPSALGKAHGILLRAALESPPPDARAYAFLAMVKLQLDRSDPKAWWALKSAERANAVLRSIARHLLERSSQDECFSCERVTALPRRLRSTGGIYAETAHAAEDLLPDAAGKPIQRRCRDDADRQADT